MKSDALLIQQASGPHTYLLDLTIKDHADYCRRHNIDYHAIYGEVETGKHAFFAKVALLKQGFDAGYKFVIWLDSDCYIADDSRDLREACPDDGFGMVWHGKEVWVEGPECYDHFNAGAIYIGRGLDGWNASYLLKLWLKSSDDGHCWHDQHALNTKAIPEFEAMTKRAAPVTRLGYEWNAVPFKEFAHPAPAVAAWHGYQVDITRRFDAMQEYIRQNKMRRMVERCDVNEARQKGDYCLSTGNFEGAERFYARAEELGAGVTADFYYSYAFAFTKRNRHAEAIAVIQKGLEIEPENGMSWQLLGTCYDFIGEHAKNGKAIAKALQYSPNFPPLMHNLSLWQCRDGQWRDGFKNMEWSFLCRERIARYPGQEWDGNRPCVRDIADPVLLVWAEQGLGDTVMLSRYIGRAAAAPHYYPQGVNRLRLVWDVDHAIFEVQQPLVELLKAQNWGGVEIVGRPADNSLPWKFDVHVGAFTLPHLMGATVQNTTGAAYLKAPDDKVLEWKRRMGGYEYEARIEKRILKVGFSWAGSQQHGNNHNRNTEAGFFDALTALPNTRWYSLQRDLEIPEEVKAGTPEVEFIGHEFADMADTAGVLANLDLVITIDSAIAHLCGALGVPCWVLLSKSADWRWLTEGETTVWYDSLKLYRQETLGDWAGVFDRVKQALEDRLQGGA